jgi:hypothetical protein
MDSPRAVSSDFETCIQRGFLDNSRRKIIINKEYIEFEDKNLINSENSRIDWKDFDGIRYGYEQVRGFYFNIGWRRQIFIRDSAKKQIKIYLTSLYNFRNKWNQEKFSMILQAILNAFLTNHVAQLINLVKSGQIVSLAGTQVSKDEIVFNFKKELIKIDFLILNMASYRRYF